MSRVGKKPVPIVSGVTANVEGQTVKMKGPKGALQFVVHDDVSVELKDGAIRVAPRFETKRAQSLYGTARAQIANLVEGVTKGFEKKLSLIGVGYKATAQGAKLNLAVGYSHPVNKDMPAGITVATPTPTEVVIKGADRQRVGQVAAEIRAIRPPEPYKGKGIRYADEKITIKETKKK